jgi:hypothetical protein
VLFYGAATRKIAHATILILALLFSAEAQLVMVMANPYGPWWNPDAQYPDWGYPEITITSPVQNGTYPQNNVWLNLTVTKPSNWTDYEGHLTFVAYLIDGDRNNLTNSLSYYNVGENRVAVDDPLGVVNSPLAFNLTIKLEELSEGNHHVDVAAWGLVNYGESDVPVGSGCDTIYFIVAKESSAFPTTLLTAAVLTVAVVGIGLPFYFKKRNR